jgi:hypothetical protein
MVTDEHIHPFLHEGMVSLADRLKQPLIRHCTCTAKCVSYSSAPNCRQVWNCLPTPKSDTRKIWPQLKIGTSIEHD